MTKTVLILGGNGFIGVNIVDVLSKLYNVKVFGRKSRIKHELCYNVEYIEGEFSDTRLLQKSLKGVDVVIHSLTSTIPSTSNLNPINDINENLLNTIKLLDLMREMSVNDIIFISSGGTIYGNFDEFLTETHLTNPLCSYGIVKLAIENYLNMYDYLYGLNRTILRLSNPYGPYQNKIGIQGVISTFFDKAYNDQEIHIWGDGNIIRDYIYIDDVTDVISKLVANNILGTYNLGSGCGVSLNEILNMVEKITKKKLSIKYFPARKFDAKMVLLDINKLESVLKWTPKISLYNGCEKYWEWLNNEKNTKN